MTDIYDRDNKPERTPEMINGHQVWVWMGAGPHPHWEIRGTGVIMPDGWVRRGRS